MARLNKRRFLTLAGLIALSLVFIINRGYITQFSMLAGRVHWYTLVMVFVVQVASYYSNAKFYQTFLAIFDYKIDTKRLFEAAIAINFVNQAFPSGGLSGASFLSQYLRDEVPVGKASLAQFVRYVFTFLSFLIVLTVGFLLLFWSGNVSRITVRFTLLFIILLLTMSMLLVTVAADRERMQAVAGVVIRILNRLNKIIRRKRRRLITKEQTDHFFDEFYEGYHLLLAERRHWKWPLFYSLCGNVAEVTTIYAVFVAFGVLINPGIVIAGYTIANVFSVLSVVSSGVGLYEATMIGAFTALGLPFALSFSVVIVYRVINFGLFLPLGFWYYRRRVNS